MAFNSVEGDLEKIFIDDYALIDQHPLASPGSLWTWGGNSYGQLGTNNYVHRSSPVQTISAGTNWKGEVSEGAGQYPGHTAAIKTDGTLWLWGRNGTGCLGTNDRTDRYSPVQTVSGGTNWSFVSAGSYCTAALKTDGTLWLWGRNDRGQLGDNTNTYRSSPVQTVAGGTNWKQLSYRSQTGAAIKTDGTLWMWGPNFWGTLGDNTITHRSSPVQTISGGTNWRYVSCSASNTAAIKTDGTLWLWGLNNAGQLGDNTITKRSSPVQTISGGTNWKQVASGGSNTAAIKTDGTLWLWGENFLGCLGDNTMTHRSSPVQTVAGGTDWRRVNKTQSHTAAIKTDGTLWLWGYNNNGKLGTNNTTHYSSPVQTVAGGNNWNWVSTTASSTIATKFNN